jgi:hypothetical protein
MLSRTAGMLAPFPPLVARDLICWLLCLLLKLLKQLLTACRPVVEEVGAVDQHRLGGASTVLLTRLWVECKPPLLLAGAREVMMMPLELRCKLIEFCMAVRAQAMSGRAGAKLYFRILGSIYDFVILQIFTPYYFVL